MIYVSSASSSGDGTQANPWRGWDTAITWSSFTHYHFETGWYAYDDSPNFLQPGIHLIGEAGVFLQHTGRGDAFVMDAVTANHWIMSCRVENINLMGSVDHFIEGGCESIVDTNQVFGYSTHFTENCQVGDAITIQLAGTNQCRTQIITAIIDDTHLEVDAIWTAHYAGEYWIGKTRHGFNLTRVRNGMFVNCSVHNVFGDGFHSEQCVTNMLTNFRLTLHEPVQDTEFLIRSLRGIHIDNESTCWTVQNPVIEGVQLVAGIHIASSCFRTSVINGTCESNVLGAVGLLIDGTHNHIDSLDLEANDGGNVVDNGSNNIIENTQL